MTKISFIFKDHRGSLIEYESWKSSSTTIRGCIDSYNNWIWMNPKKDVYSSIKIKIYVENKLIDNLDQTFLDLITANKQLLDNPKSPKYGYGRSKGHILITIKRILTIIKNLTDDEMDKPIINFLLTNDISRACWLVEGKSIDINNSFNQYNLSNEYIGYNRHKPNCDINKCDLIVCSSSHSGIFYTMIDRSTVYDSMFLINDKNDPLMNNFFDLIRLPLLCNKQTIIKKFLEDAALYYQHSKEVFYKSLKPIEIDVYFASRDTSEDNIVEDSIERITNNNNYVLEFFKRNENGIDDCWGHQNKKYVFVLKSFRSNDFNALLINTLPIDDLLDIIYDYVDFESIEPAISTVFDY